MANGEFSDSKLAGSAKEECKHCAKILRVEFLEGEDDVLLDTAAVQWVNLPRDPKWVVKSKVTSMDRLGMEPRVKVEFDRDGKHSFRLWLEAAPENLTYSDSEKKRNKNFTFSDKATKLKTDKNGSRVVQAGIKLNACGMNQFRAVASDDHGNEVRSQWLTVKRLVFVQEVLMKSTTSSPWPNLIAEYAKHGLEFEFLASSTIDDLNVDINDPTNQNMFFNAVRTACRPAAARYAPHLILLGKVISVVESAIEEFKLPVAAGQTSLRFKTEKQLWDVDASPWLESAFYYRGSDLSGEKTAVACSRDPSNPSYGVIVNTSGVSASAGVVVVRVRRRDSSGSGGYSFPDTNLTCALGKDKDAEVLVMHEIGHHIGMVPDGSGSSPDKTATYYVEMGHSGPHCHFGLPAPGTPMPDGAPRTTYVFQTGNCLMFGKASTTKLCVSCTVAARKTDIGMGWPSL